MFELCSIYMWRVVLSARFVELLKSEIALSSVQAANDDLINVNKNCIRRTPIGFERYLVYLSRIDRSPNLENITAPRVVSSKYVRYRAPIHARVYRQYYRFENIRRVIVVFVTNNPARSVSMVLHSPVSVSNLTLFCLLRTDTTY